MRRVVKQPAVKPLVLFSIVPRMNSNANHDDVIKKNVMASHSLISYSKPLQYRCTRYGQSWLVLQHFH